MARRRHRNNTQKIEITYLKDGSKEVAELIGTSKSGKSIQVILNGKSAYVALNKIEYKTL